MDSRAPNFKKTKKHYCISSDSIRKKKYLIKKLPLGISICNPENLDYHKQVFALITCSKFSNLNGVLFRNFFESSIILFYNF
jgi:hypothetical protein